MNTEEYVKLLPEITDGNRAFWEGCNIGELRMQICLDCGTWRFPDSDLCPNCLSHDAEWHGVSGKATLWSWVVMHQRYFDAFADELPYVVLLVELEEGVRLISGLEGDPARLEVNQPMEVVFSRVNDERSIPKFRIVT